MTTTPSEPRVFRSYEEMERALMPKRASERDAAKDPGTILGERAIEILRESIQNSVNA